MPLTIGFCAPAQKPGLDIAREVLRGQPGSAARILRDALRLAGSRDRLSRIFQGGRKIVTYRLGFLLALAGLLLGGCGKLLGEQTPRASAPSDMRRVAFEIVAKGGRCEPSVLAADREGRALLITFQVTSLDGSYYFVVPGADIRKEIPANTRVEIPWIADRSGIHEYACTTRRWITPFTPTGKLAVK